MSAQHGTNAGYCAGCRCEPCCEASWRYHKHLHYDHTRGLYRTIDGTGTRRRLRALKALGWSFAQIGARLGCSGDAVRQSAERDRVLRSHAEKVAALYEEMSMTLPPAETHRQRQIVSRERNRARRLGWAPPLAWDDIDDPKARPRYGTRKRDFYDEVLVLRFVATGEKHRILRHDEAVEAYRRLRLRGHSTHEIEERWGLKSDRYEGTRRAS